MLLLLFMGCVCVVGEVHSESITISNVKPRMDVNGDIVVGGDGSIQLFNDTYYYYAQDYTNCTEPTPVKNSLCVFPLNHTCGYLYTHRVAVYTSKDLHTFTPVSMNAFPHAPQGVKFRVKVVYNPTTRLYILWVRNVPLAGGSGGARPSWLEETYVVATSESPAGPFKLATAKADVKYNPGGDDTLFVDDDGVGYLAYTSHSTGVRIQVERLASDMIHSTHQVSETWGAPSSEAPAMFKRKGWYYVTFGLGCCYCLTGSTTNLYASRSPLGPYQEVGLMLNKTQSHAQQSYVFETRAGEWVWTGTRWGSSPDGEFRHAFQTWLPMVWQDEFSPPRVTPIDWVDQFDLRV